MLKTENRGLCRMKTVYEMRLQARNKNMKKRTREPIQIALGVDQTGATQNQGSRFRPLPVARAWRTKGAPREIHLQVLHPGTRTPFWAAQFDRLALLGVIADVELGDRCPRVLVDAVLGLPFDITSQNHLQGDLRAALRDAGQFFVRRQREGLSHRGRLAAEAYFEGLLKSLPGTQGVPTREAERLAGANSVFLSRPYQKNVQTGTFRIWVELARWLDEETSHQDVCFPHHDPSTFISPQKWRVEESWPSLLWRTLLGVKVRSPKELGGALKSLEKSRKIRFFCDSENLEFCATHPDHADALVLALGGILLPESQQQGPPGEGWITGLVKAEGAHAKLEAQSPFEHEGSNHEHSSKANQTRE